MKVLYNDNHICDIPSSININDTIIVKDVVYIIITKTFDYDADELYCKVELYEEDKENKEITVIDIFRNLYDSEYLITSGMNTNDVKNNPRYLVFAILTAVIFGPNAKSAIKNVIQHWGAKNIPWSVIFSEDIKPITTNIGSIIKITKKILIEKRISKELWPKTVKDEP